MYAYKTGIVETVMSALSFLVVRGQTRTSRPRRRPVRLDATGRTSIQDAQRRKETYFAMAREVRWNR